MAVLNELELTRRGLLTGADGIGLRGIPFGTDDAEEAWTWMLGSVHQGRSVILCVQNWEHWVAVIGTLGQTILLADSSQEYPNQLENGILVLNKEKLLHLWRYHLEDSSGAARLYGIALEVQ